MTEEIIEHPPIMVSQKLIQNLITKIELLETRIQNVPLSKRDNDFDYFLTMVRLQDEKIQTLQARIQMLEDRIPSPVRNTTTPLDNMHLDL